MTYMIDIDGTLCTKMSNYKEYHNAVPYPERIALVNKLYDEGHTINLWTARGSSSGVDCSEITKQQIEEWGVKHHSLKLGKPVYDVWVDDKAEWIF